MKEKLTQCEAQINTNKVSDKFLQEHFAHILCFFAQFSQWVIYAMVTVF